MKTKKKLKKKNNKTLKCSPSSKKKYSCYSDKGLYKLKKFWNIKHPEKKINSNKPNDIWNILREKLSNSCDNEKCWLRQEFIKSNLDQELLNYTFAPEAPNTWKRNKNTWLSSVDIEKVMRQYEKAFPFYTFIGPTPIDFDKRQLFNSCVWDELCKFDLNL